MSDEGLEAEDHGKQMGFVPGAHAIDSYGNGGFRFAGMSHRGSILVLPTGVQSWPVPRKESINVASLTAVILEASQIDVLLVGTGDASLPPNAPFAQALREQGISVEVMDTAAATRTYNLMFSQGRRVAAALVAVG